MEHLTTAALSITEQVYRETSAAEAFMNVTTASDRWTLPPCVYTHDNVHFTTQLSYDSTGKQRDVLRRRLLARIIRKTPCSVHARKPINNSIPYVSQSHTCDMRRYIQRHVLIITSKPAAIWHMVNCVLTATSDRQPSRRRL